MAAIDLSLLILRLAVGAVMIAHGVNHGRNLEGTARWFESLGFRRPRENAFLSAAGEIAIGTALILGILTPFAAAGLVATMVVAWIANHRRAGFFVFNRPVEGWEYVMVLTAIGAALAISGAGAASVDAALGLELAFWQGVALAVLGVLAGLGQLALFWRPTAASRESADGAAVAS